MSLIFYITPRSVRIQKYGLEFALNLPPENLTHAAQGAYALLRQSVSTQTDSSREEREEALGLLKLYGKSLFEAIIPPELNKRIHKEGSLFIYSVYPAITNLPWELLFDGSSFFALTQGVVRINESKPSFLTWDQKRNKDVLDISLNAYTPLLPVHRNGKHGEHFPQGNRFITRVEELPGANLLNMSNIRFQVSGNASRESLLLALEKEPDIFFFSGYHTTNGWVIDGENKNYSSVNWYRCELLPALKKAVEKGLKLLILNTSNLIDPKNQDTRIYLGSFFDQGLPYVLSIGGRVARHRLQLYFQNLSHGLSQGENILKAHRQALNKLSSSLPLAWDWSWIQLHVNKRFIESDTGQPAFSFDLEGTPAKVRPHLFFAENNFICNHRRFSGSFELLKKISTALRSEEGKIYSIESVDGAFQEEYLQEFFRRQAADRRFSLSVLYYNDFSMGHASNVRLEVGKQQFSSLYALLDVNKALDESLTHICYNEKNKDSNRYLVVYAPPKEADPMFENWLQNKLQKGWTIVLLPMHSFMCSLPVTRFQSLPATFSEVIAAFEDNLPEKWIKMMGNGLPKQMENIALLWIVKNYNYSYLIDLFCSKQSSKTLWEATFSTIIPKLSVNRLNVFLTLLLLQGRCRLSFLSQLFPEQKIEGDLAYLNQIHLIDRSLDSTYYWVPVHIIQQVGKYQLISKGKIESAGLDILKRYTSILDPKNIPEKSEMAGFQVVVKTLLEYGIIEEPLLRLLQFCKKFASHAKKSPTVFIRKLIMVLEVALIKNEQIPLKKIVGDMGEVMEKLSYIREAVDIYRWLMRREEKQRNWQNVAEFQKKLALIFVRVGEKEKAIGLLTSAIQLNKDIKSFAYRYNNLISIALLLIDIGELGKVAKLVNNTDFDVELLSQECIDRLWLIDGHLLYAEKKYKEAMQSFSKILDLSQINIEDSLRAKSFLYLSELYQLEGENEKSLQAKNDAADFFIISRKYLQARKICQSLYQHYSKEGNTVIALTYLSSLFELYKKEGDKVKMQETAHELGGLYFKIGDESQSTRFYKIAQEV